MQKVVGEGRKGPVNVWVEAVGAAVNDEPEHHADAEEPDAVHDHEEAAGPATVRFNRGRCRSARRGRRGS